MTISENGLNLIQQFEGFRDKAYQDSAGLWTIGFGTITYPDGSKVKEGDECTAIDAENWLILDVQDAVNGINKLSFLKPLNQTQYDALVSFAYNLGLGALRGSTLYKKAQL